MFHDCKTLIYRKDYIGLDEAIRKSEHFENTELISWSDKEEMEASIRISIVPEEYGVGLEINAKSESMYVHLAYADKASVENAV